MSVILKNLSSIHGCNVHLLQRLGSGRKLLGRAQAQSFYSSELGMDIFHSIPLLVTSLCQAYLQLLPQSFMKVEVSYFRPALSNAMNKLSELHSCFLFYVASDQVVLQAGSCMKRRVSSLMVTTFPPGL